MRLHRGLLLGLAVLATTPCQGQPSTWELVWRSERATAKASAVGRVRTMAVDNGGSRSATAYVQSAGGKVRLDYEAGPRRWTIIDDGENLIRLDPRSRTATLHGRPRLAVDRSLAERNYTARTSGEMTVAGMPAVAVEIAPRRGGPVVRRLWLDRSTSFVLKRERYNAEGRLTSQTEYIEVEIGAPVSAEAFSVPPDWVTVERGGDGPSYGTSDLSRRMGFVVQPPGYLPEDYILLGGYEQEWGRWGVRLAELRYTDGIRILNVYQREHRGDEPGRRRGHSLRDRLFGEKHGGGRGRGRGRGGGHGFGPPGQEHMTVVDRGTEKAVRYHGESRVVVVVGDLRADELVRIAESVGDAPEDDR